MKIKISILAFLVIITTLSGCGSSKAINYEKYAAAREYPAWLKNNTPLFGWGNASQKRADAFLDQAKAAIKKQEEEEKRQTKIEQTEAEAEALRAKLTNK